jgi:hypothetical protein
MSVVLINQEIPMTIARKMLLESLRGHLALLGKVSPAKAASPVAKQTDRYVKSLLRLADGRMKRLNHC